MKIDTSTIEKLRETISRYEFNNGAISETSTPSTNCRTGCVMACVGSCDNTCAGGCRNSCSGHNYA